MNYPKIIIDINTGTCNCHTCNKSLIKVPSAGGCGCISAQIPVTGNTSNSPCEDCEGECEDMYPSNCILYSGGDIPQLGIKTDDRLDKIIIILAAEVLALKQRVAALEV